MENSKSEVLLPDQGHGPQAVKVSSSSQLSRCSLINWKWWEYLTRQGEANEGHGTWACRNWNLGLSSSSSTEAWVWGLGTGQTWLNSLLPLFSEARWKSFFFFF